NKKSYLNLEMDTEGVVKGSVSSSADKYESTGYRKSLLSGSPEEFFSHELEEERIAFEVTKSEVKNLKELDKPLKLKSEINYEPESAGDLLYLDAFLEKYYTENPFKLEERKYPVDFSYPFQNSYTMVLKLPENVQVEDLPKSVAVSLPDKTGKFSFVVDYSPEMNNIQVRSSLTLGKTVFAPTEYQGLKEFYNLMIEKMQAKIVLKKVNN
ncbi:MAG: DUF3858 domain-containing protein, partial [Bacteroidota bacterium]